MNYEEDDLAYHLAAKADQAKEKEKIREPRPPRDPRGKYHEGRRPRHLPTTPLNGSRAKIFSDCANVELKNIKRPDPIAQMEGPQSKRFCRYHNSTGHDTNGCRALKEDIESLIQKGKLKQYLKKDEQPGVGQKKQHSPPGKDHGHPGRGRLRQMIVMKMRPRERRIHESRKEAQ